MIDFKYAGSELELFAAAENWKSYWARQVRPFLGGDVLEVGAGIGSNTRVLDPGGTGRWVCLEPDPQLAAELRNNLAAGKDERRYETVCGTLQALDGQQFDAVVYIDVLEHIEDDAGELQAAAAQLRPGGRLIVLAPAHPFLFTPFDAAIGHFRRYTSASLRRLTPPGLRLERLRYLDSMGLTASAANRLFFRQSLPTKAQLLFWDGWIVPVSRVFDKLLFYSVGKSILAVWRRPVSV